MLRAIAGAGIFRGIREDGGRERGKQAEEEAEGKRWRVIW